MFDLMAQKLASSVISDILDTFGFRDQVMRATIRPLYPEAMVVGRAMPVLYAEVFEVPEKPYQMEIEVVDSLRPDDVLVAYAPASAKAALWGGILSTAAKARGARVVVIPQDVAAETVNEALRQAAAEHFAQEELKKGTLLREAYAKHGVL